MDSAEAGGTHCLFPEGATRLALVMSPPCRMQAAGLSHSLSSLPPWPAAGEPAGWHCWMFS